jgi:phage-related protein
MMPWFIWKGKNSLSEFGLWINKLPSRMRADERNEQVEIPGRAGSVILLEGEDVYKSYVANITVIARNSLNISRILDWLRGSGDLIISTESDKAREARIVGKVEFSRLGNNLQQATIPFLCQPFRKSLHPEQADRITITGSSSTIFNPGDVASNPIVKITGSGEKTIVIAGTQMKFQHVEGTLTVDCDAQIITAHSDAYDSSRYYYKGDYCTASNKLYTFTDSGTGSALVSGGKREEVSGWDGNAFDYIWPGTYEGEFWKLPKGESAYSRTGSATVVIDPNWRWL